MAYIILSDLSRLSLSGEHNAELKPLQMLKEELPNDFTVFHAVHCLREYEAWKKQTRDSSSDMETNNFIEGRRSAETPCRIG